MVKTGPGYASPLEAMKGPKEKLMYVICVQPNSEKGKHDLLATVDVDPESPTYCKIIHRLHTLHPGDELHHSGWNSCSSCYKVEEGCCKVPVRDKLILPSLVSDRIYVVDTGKNPKAPSFLKVIEPSEMHTFNCTSPHTTHCLASGEIMISTMGDNKGDAKGDFILLDGETFKIKGTWAKTPAKFGYDFWYQPYHDIMISTEWGAPRIWKRGFLPEDPLDKSTYGRSLNFFSWSGKNLIKTIDLGDDGIAPLETRFLHNPKESQGFVGCCLNANVYRFFQKEDKSWDAEKVIDVKPKKVANWVGDYLPGMITDIIISLDDKYLYFSNWLHGDVRQYDISDRKHPKLTGQVFLGGKILSDSDVKVLEDPELTEPPKPVFVKGKRLYGGPQMLQLSLDGKRLYVSSSLYSVWDLQFYPDNITNGSFMVKLDVDVKNGGMKLDPNFYVDFKEGPDGPILAHEMRYPGGDCSSDIWLAED